MSTPERIDGPAPGSHEGIEAWAEDVSALVDEPKEVAPLPLIDRLFPELEEGDDRMLFSVTPGIGMPPVPIDTDSDFSAINTSCNRRDIPQASLERTFVDNITSPEIGDTGSYDPDSELTIIGLMNATRHLLYGEPDHRILHRWVHLWTEEEREAETHARHVHTELRNYLDHPIMRTGSDIIVVPDAGRMLIDAPNIRDFDWSVYDAQLPRYAEFLDDLFVAPDPNNQVA